MSATMRTLKLALLADTSKYNKGLSQASKQTMTFNQKVAKYAKIGATAFLGLATAATYAAARIGGEAIKAASDLNEELSKTNVIFGDASKEIKDFAKIADKSLGLSKTAALKAAGNFAIFAKAAKLSGREVPAFSKKLVTLSSDLASFYNTSTDDAILAVGAALRGESEPIRRYGVLLSQAALEQYALNYETRTGTTLARDAKNQLTDESKVLARYQGIIEQTTVAQGDFNRTSEGLANQQRILSAGIENAKAAFGEALLPIMVKLVNYANDTFIPLIKRVADGFSGKPDSISNKLKQVGKDLGYAPDSGPENLGRALRNVAEAFGNLFTTVTTDGESTASTLQQIADSLERVADGMDSVARNWGKFKAVWEFLNGNDVINEAEKNLQNKYNLTRRAPRNLNPTAYGVGQTSPALMAGGSVGAKTGSAGNTFIFNGVIDGESARRSIERLLQTSARRTGEVSFAGRHL